MSEALLPDWFLIRASGGALDRIGDDGLDEVEVANRGSFRAYVGKAPSGPGQTPGGARGRKSPSRRSVCAIPAHGGLPSGLDAGEILDGIAAALPDGGTYQSLVFYGVSSATDETRDALDRGIVAAILGGAAPNEIANRVEVFRIQQEDHGFVDTGLELRRVATVDGTRVLSVFTPDGSNDLPGGATVLHGRYRSPGPYADVPTERRRQCDPRGHQPCRQPGHRTLRQ